MEPNIKIVDETEIQGIEDEFIIYSITTGSNYNPLDVLTRARNGLAIIIDTDSEYVTKTKNIINLILVDHSSLHF